MKTAKKYQQYNFDLQISSLNNRFHDLTIQLYTVKNVKFYKADFMLKYIN